MEEFLKQNWFKVSIILIAVFIVGGYFYWLQYKPSQIRQKCFAEAEFDGRAVFEFNEKIRQENIDNYYKECIKRFGL